MISLLLLFHASAVNIVVVVHVGDNLIASLVFSGMGACQLLPLFDSVVWGLSISHLVLSGTDYFMNLLVMSMCPRFQSLYICVVYFS
jgi:hypothetical protein